MGDSHTLLMHATCVWLAGRGILLRGQPGAGKSDLALRLMGGGGMLVADDQVALRAWPGWLEATAPAVLAGLIEVRGAGVVRVPYRRKARIDLLVDLMAAGDVPRLPEREHEVVAGVGIPRYRLDLFEASAVAKLRMLGREEQCLAPVDRRTLTG